MVIHAGLDVELMESEVEFVADNRFAVGRDLKMRDSELDSFSDLDYYVEGRDSSFMEKCRTDVRDEPAMSTRDVCEGCCSFGPLPRVDERAFAWLS